MMTKLQVGLLIGGRDQPGWVGDLIDELKTSTAVTLAGILVAKPPIKPRSHSLLEGVARLENRLLGSRERDRLKIHTLVEDEQTPFLDLTLTTQASGQQEVSESELATAVRDLPLDVLIIVGMRSVRGALVSYPRVGFWQLSLSDIASAQGGHAGFWEVYQRADHTAVKLWKIAATADQDQLVDQRSFNTEVFWLKNQIRALTLGNFMVRDALESVALFPAGHVCNVEQASFPVRRRAQPAAWDSAAYVARQTVLMSELLWRRLTKKNVIWRIGMCPTLLPQLGASEAVVLTAPKGRFFADPFVYTKGDQPYIFFEDYAFDEGKGKISVATYEAGEFKFLGTVLDLPYHLSFPCIFEHGGETFMVPETCGNRTIELWKCVDFPLKWKLEATLMTDISAVDTIIFPHENRWWLLTNIDRTDGASHCDELFAFYADSPDSTDWKPHAQNPIVRSPSKARNAGMLRSSSGKITRCAQYQGFCHYGKGLSLNEIVHLSPELYVEKDGQIHYAGFRKKKQLPSMHHWHHHGGHTVFDFAYME
jgi:hypothetical protein